MERRRAHIFSQPYPSDAQQRRFLSKAGNKGDGGRAGGGRKLATASAEVPQWKEARRLPPNTEPRGGSASLCKRTAPAAAQGRPAARCP